MGTSVSPCCEVPTPSTQGTGDGQRRGMGRCARRPAGTTWPTTAAARRSERQGITLVHVGAQLEHIRYTLHSFTLELNLSTFGTQS